jgi:hypothetical protein
MGSRCDMNPHARSSSGPQARWAFDRLVPFFHSGKSIWLYPIEEESNQFITT